MLKTTACNRGIVGGSRRRVHHQEARRRSAHPHRSWPSPSSGTRGACACRINPQNAGPTCRVIHYAEDSTVSESSPVLKGQPVLDNGAARGLPRAAIRRDSSKPATPVVNGRINSRCAATSRANMRANACVELFVAPRGEIRYTLDGSEPRDGRALRGPDRDWQRRSAAARLRHSRRPRGQAGHSASSPQARLGIQIDPAKSARLMSRSGPQARLKRQSTFEGLKQAEDKTVHFESLRHQRRTGRPRPQPS